MAASLAALRAGVQNPCPDTRISNAALNLLERQSIRPIPSHYTLAFEAASGRAPDLQEELCTLHGRSVETEARLDDLYKGRISPPEAAPQAPAKIPDALAGQMDNVLANMAAAGGQAEKFGSALTAFSKGLKSGAAIGNVLEQLVAGMADATTATANEMARLKGELDRSANQIAELTGRLDEAKAEATIDTLTGLGNRRAFDAALNEAINAGKGLVLIMGDVDHFKRFNDRWGHQLGDQVLRLFGATLGQVTEGYGHACRYGGEEFAMILPAISTTDAVALAEKVRRAMEVKQIRHKATGESVGAITISFGAAEWRHGEDALTLTARADAALYQSKEAGRNRVTLA